MLIYFSFFELCFYLLQIRFYFIMKTKIIKKLQLFLLIFRMFILLIFRMLILLIFLIKKRKF